MAFIDDLSNLINEVKDSPFPQSPVHIMDSIISIAHKHGISTMHLVLKADEIQKQELQNELLAKWHGVDSACNSLITMLEKSTDKSKAGKFAQDVLFNPENIAHTIQHLKAWIPNPEKGGFSQSSQKLLSIVLDTFNLDRYLEGGSSHTWAVEFGHFDYILRLKALQDARKESLTSNPTE